MMTMTVTLKLACELFPRESEAVQETSVVPTANVAPEPGLHDHVILFEGVTWADYQRLLEIRGDRSAPRMSFLEGKLEIMSPSKWHERVKSNAGHLVVAWCEVRGVEISAYGSWTLEDETVERGVEADECFVLGDVARVVRIQPNAVASEVGAVDCDLAILQLRDRLVVVPFIVVEDRLKQERGRPVDSDDVSVRQPDFGPAAAGGDDLVTGVDR